MDSEYIDGQSLDNELIDLLRAVSSGFQARMQEQVAANRWGLTAFQARLINLIGRNEGISQLTLASFTERDKAQIARAIKALEARGLVTRSAHASDWRSQCLALTAQGGSIHAELIGLRRKLAATALRSVTEEEKRALQAGLLKMKGALED